MIENKNVFVPFEYAQTGRLRNAVTLPEYVNTENILVNLTGIHRLCNIGGIRHLRIQSINGDVTKEIPTIVGFNQNGEAFAGKVNAKESVPEYESTSKTSGEVHYHATSWTNTTITLNTAEISKRITDNENWEKGTRDTKAWSFHLNKDIKKGITKEGARHLTIGLNTSNWINTAFQYGMMAVFETMSGPTVERAAFRVVFISALLNTLNFVMAHEKKDFRFSLFYGPQPDRAMWLYLNSIPLTLVKSGDNLQKGIV